MYFLTVACTRRDFQPLRQYLKNKPFLSYVHCTITICTVYIVHLKIKKGGTYQPRGIKK